MEKSINIQIKELQEKMSKELEESKLPSSILLLIVQNLTNQLNILNNNFILQEIQKTKEEEEENKKSQ